MRKLQMKIEKILITVKTYPTLSTKYTELVCTAGFKKDGSWIRLYPSPFRFLQDDQRYKKYQWIELEIEKNPKDPRPESFRPCNIDNITLGDIIPAKNNWKQRRSFIFSNNIIHENLNNIIDSAHKNLFSLAIFKPKEIIDLKVKEEENKGWDLNKKQIIEELSKQGSLFEKFNDESFKLIRKLPYKFYYHFIDNEDKESTLMIEDWEIGQLYWNCFKSYKCERTAIDKVKERYLDDFTSNKDIYLFLGTTRRWHFIAPNPYVIIGVFYPNKIKQYRLPL